MNGRTAALLHLLTWIALSGSADGRGVLSIKLREFYNPTGRTFDGGCCDAGRRTDDVYTNCGDGCDYVMRLIVSGLGRANDHVFLFHRPLKYNSNDVIFPHHDYNMVLTVLFDKWPVHDRVKMSAFFYDYDDLDHTTTLVDWFVTDLRNASTDLSSSFSTGDPTRDNDDSSQAQHTKTIKGKRRYNKTKLVFQWSVICSDGDDCNQLPSTGRGGTFSPTTSIFEEFEQVHVGKNSNYNRNSIQNVQNSKRRADREQPAMTTSRRVLHPNIKHTTRNQNNMNGNRLDRGLTTRHASSFVTGGITQRRRSKNRTGEVAKVKSPSFSLSTKKYSASTSVKDKPHKNKPLTPESVKDKPHKNKPLTPESVKDKPHKNKPLTPEPVKIKGKVRPNSPSKSRVSKVVSAAAAATPPPHASARQQRTSHGRESTELPPHASARQLRTSHGRESKEHSHIRSRGNLHLNRNSVALKDRPGRDNTRFDNSHNKPDPKQRHDDYPSATRHDESPIVSDTRHKKEKILTKQNRLHHNNSINFNFYKIPKPKNSTTAADIKSMSSKETHFDQTISPPATYGQGQNFRFHQKPNPLSKGQAHEIQAKTGMLTKNKAEHSDDYPPLLTPVMPSHSLQPSATKTRLTPTFEGPSRTYTFYFEDKVHRNISGKTPFPISGFGVKRDFNITRRLPFMISAHHQNSSSTRQKHKSARQMRSRYSKLALLKSNQTPSVLTEMKQENEVNNIVSDQDGIRKPMNVNMTAVIKTNDKTPKYLQQPATTHSKPTARKSINNSPAKTNSVEWNSEAMRSHTLSTPRRGDEANDTLTLRRANIPQHAITTSMNKTKTTEIMTAKKPQIESLSQEKSKSPENFTRKGRLSSHVYVTPNPVGRVVETGADAVRDTNRNASSRVASRKIARPSNIKALYNSIKKLKAVKFLTQAPVEWVVTGHSAFDKNHWRVSNFSLPSTTASVPIQSTSQIPPIAFETGNRDNITRKRNKTEQNTRTDGGVDLPSTKDPQDKPTLNEDKNTFTSTTPSILIINDLARNARYRVTNDTPDRKRFEISTSIQIPEIHENRFRHDFKHNWVSATAAKSQPRRHPTSKRDRQRPRDADVKTKYTSDTTNGGVLQTNVQHQGDAVSKDGLHENIDVSHAAKQTTNGLSKYTTKDATNNNITTKVFSSRPPKRSDDLNNKVSKANAKADLPKIKTLNESFYSKSSRLPAIPSEIWHTKQVRSKSDDTFGKKSNEPPQPDKPIPDIAPYSNNVDKNKYPRQHAASNHRTSHNYDAAVRPNVDDTDFTRAASMEHKQHETNLSLVGPKEDINSGRSSQVLADDTSDHPAISIKPEYDIENDTVSIIYNETITKSRTQQFNETLHSVNQEKEHPDTNKVNDKTPVNINKLASKDNINDFTERYKYRTITTHSDVRINPLDVSDNKDLAPPVIQGKSKLPVIELTTESPLRTVSNRHGILSMELESKRRKPGQMESREHESHDPVQKTNTSTNASIRENTTKDGEYSTQRRSKSSEVPKKTQSIQASRQETAWENNNNNNNTVHGSGAGTSQSLQDIVTQPEVSLTKQQDDAQFEHRPHQNWPEISPRVTMPNKHLDKTTQPLNRKEDTLHIKQSITGLSENSKSDRKTVVVVNTTLQDNSTVKDLNITSLVGLINTISSHIEQGQNKSNQYRQPSKSERDLLDLFISYKMPNGSILNQTHDNVLFQKVLSTSYHNQSADLIKNILTNSTFSDIGKPKGFTSLVFQLNNLVVSIVENNVDIKTGNLQTTKGLAKDQKQLSITKTTAATTTELQEETDDRNTEAPFTTSHDVTRLYQQTENKQPVGYTELSPATKNVQYSITQRQMKRFEHNKGFLEQLDLFRTVSPTSKIHRSETLSEQSRFPPFGHITFRVKTLPDEGFKLHTQTPSKHTTTNDENKTKRSSIVLPDPKLVREPKTQGVQSILPAEVNIQKLRKYLFEIRHAPTVNIPSKGLFEDTTVTEPEAESSAIPSGSPGLAEPSRKRHLMDMKTVFKRYWPAVFGAAVGTLFLLTALVTSLVCRQRRLLIQRDRWTDSPRHLSEPPDTSEYATSSAASLNSDFARSSSSNLG